MNKLKIGGNHQKRSMSHSVVTLDNQDWSKFKETSVYYYVCSIPENVLVCRGYSTLVDTLDDTSISVILHFAHDLSGTRSFPGFSSLAPGESSEASFSNTYYPHGALISVRFGSNVPTIGKIHATLEYIELDKRNGELTQVPVRDIFA